eukprot:GFUD01011060.1.p1 GENE.GFUD01011060.1~~GFUD01011060.1.p1  ORF type:complete len:409 (+),score=73.73 GFUD01011060.1:151-1377(+)
MDDSVKKKMVDKVKPKRTTFSEILLGESRVMCRWRSSLWKLLWRELLAYTITFLLISLIYRLALTEAQQIQFEMLARWCGKMYTGLPLTFLLGFYVSLVVKRWWEQYCFLPWPDSIAFFLRGLVIGGDNEKNRMIRRTVIRYCLLSYVLCIRRLSVRLRKRFPTMQELIRTGLIRPDEAERVGDEDSHEMYGSNWWMPLKWCAELLSKAMQEGEVKSPPGYNGLLGQIATFRSSLTKVATYGHIPVPLVYTQVVTMAVYVYFIVALIGEQWLIWRQRNGKWQGDELNLYYPIFMTVKFLFFFGWLRVAETLYNPFGEDDDDFELNGLINRHFKVAMNIVDENEEPPELQKDIFWGQVDPVLQDFPPWDENYVSSMFDTDVEKVYDTPEGDERGSQSFRTVQEMRDPMQ